MRVVYLDTNVYTHLAELLEPAAVPRLRGAAHQIGLAVVISPMVLVEILALGETEKKEGLVWVAQHLAEDELLPEVEAIIVDYAARVTGDEKVAHLALQHRTAREPLRTEWKRVVADTRRTLGVTHANIQLLATMRELYGLYHAAFSRGIDLVDVWGPQSSDFFATKPQDLPAFFRDKAREIRRLPPPVPRDPQHSMHLALISAHIMCVGLSPFWDPLDEYWAALDIHGTQARFNYLLDNQGIINEGPFLAMHDFLAWQSTRKYSRGSWFDAYHLQYLQIVPELMTLDRGLLTYGQQQPPGSRLRDNMKSASDVVDALVDIAGR
jgi:hypothetical protein